MQSYGEGSRKETPQSRRRIGVTLPDLQASLRQGAGRTVRGIRAALRPLPELGRTRGNRGAVGAAAVASSDITALRRAAAANPGNYRAQLAYGQALAAAGDRAAFEPLEKAAALVPGATGEDSPHAVMARLAETARRHRARDVRVSRALLAGDHTTVEAARRLAALAEKARRPRRCCSRTTAIVAIDPFDPPAHSGLGPAGAQEQPAGDGRARVQGGARDRPGRQSVRHCDLGEAYLLANRPAEAKAEALAALEIAPSFDRAQELLLRSIKGAGAAGGRQ